MDQNLRARVVKAVSATPAARARKAQEKREQAAAAAAWEARMTTSEAVAAIAVAAAAEAAVLARIAENAAALAAYTREPLVLSSNGRDDVARATYWRAREVAAAAAAITGLAAELEAASKEHVKALMGLF